MASSTSWRARAAEAAASEGVEVDVVGGGEVELPPPSLADAIGIGDRGDVARRLRGAVALACGDLAVAAVEEKPRDIARRVCIVEKWGVRARVLRVAA